MTTIKVTGIQINFSCYASGELAEQFWTAAKSFPSANYKFSLVPYFLFCQSLELGLKAFLLLNGVPKTALKSRPFGHNLVSLLAKAKALNIQQFVALSAEDGKLVGMLNTFYDSPGGKRFQYIDPEWALKAFKGLPELSAVDQLVTRFVTNPKLKEMYLQA